MTFGHLECIGSLVQLDDPVEAEMHRIALAKFCEERQRVSANHRAGVLHPSMPGYELRVASAKPRDAPKRLLEVFAGTHSIGKVFERAGWEVVSLDSNPKCKATHVCDVRSFDKSQYPVGFFDCIWASPECTQYSIAREGKLPRDYATADSCVQAVIDLIRHYRPAVWWLENPSTGYLKARAVAEPLGRPHLVHYCKYYSDAEGFQFKKPTALWTDCQWFVAREGCTPAARCGFMAVNAKHHEHQLRRGVGNKEHRIRMPEALCVQIEEASSRAVSHNWAAVDSAGGPVA